MQSGHVEVKKVDFWSGLPDNQGGMAVDIVNLSIEFGIQTCFLLVALLIMLKLQKLDFNFLGLAGSAALASALDLIPYAGHVISLPVLLLCVTKAIGSKTFTDAIFTVAIAYALTLCFNLFLLGALVGDLRQLANPKETRTPVTQSPGRPAANTNTTTSKPATNPPTNTAIAAPPSNAILSSNTASPTVAATTTTTPTNAVPAATQPPPKPPAPLKSGSTIAQNFVVRGIITGTPTPTATIYTGVRTHNIELGETMTMDTKDGRVTVHCDELTGNKVVLTINGEQVTLYRM